MLKELLSSQMIIKILALFEDHSFKLKKILAASESSKYCKITKGLQMLDTVLKSVCNDDFTGTLENYLKYISLILW